MLRHHCTPQSYSGIVTGLDNVTQETCMIECAKCRRCEHYAVLKDQHCVWVHSITDTSCYAARLRKYHLKWHNYSRGSAESDDMKSETNVAKVHVAICISGMLRTFDKIKHDFEKTVVRFNADVFAHLHTQVGQSNSSLWWLMSRPWAKKVVFSEYNAETKAKLISYFPDYNKMRQFDTYERPYRDKSTSNRLSMWRQIFLSNELKRQYEIANNFKYTYVIRMRPDVLYTHIPPILTKNVTSKVFASSDVFAFGSSYAMDVFSSVYLNISELFKRRPSRFSGSYVSEKLGWDNFRETSSSRRLGLSIDSISMHENFCYKFIRSKGLSDVLSKDELGGRKSLAHGNNTSVYENPVIIK